jgi:hypothetical protein
MFGFDFRIWILPSKSQNPNQRIQSSQQLLAIFSATLKIPLNLFLAAFEWKNLTKQLLVFLQFLAHNNFFHSS